MVICIPLCTIYSIKVYFTMEPMRNARFFASEPNWSSGNVAENTVRRPSHPFVIRNCKCRPCEVPVSERYSASFRLWSMHFFNRLFSMDIEIYSVSSHAGSKRSLTLTDRVIILMIIWKRNGHSVPKRIMVSIIFQENRYLFLIW